MKLCFWFWLCLKRQLKKTAFWIQLLILPCASALFLAAFRQEPGMLRVAVAVMEKEKNGIAMQAAQILWSQGDVFDFYLCDSREQAADDVLSRKAECGFVFRENFTRGFEEGNLKKTVELIQSPSTVAGQLAAESVCGAVMSLAGPDALRKLAAQDFFRQAGGNDAVERMETLYKRFVTDGSTFSFLYETTEGIAEDFWRQERWVFPARGLGAVYVWAAALCAAAASWEDEKKGVYDCIFRKQKLLSVYLAVLAPVLPAAASCLAAVRLAGGFTVWGREIPAMLIYCGAASFSAVLLRFFVRREKIMYALIPALLSSSLVFCPVIIDLGLWFPAAAVLRKLFLPGYYLAFF